MDIRQKSSTLGVIARAIVILALVNIPVGATWAKSTNNDATETREALEAEAFEVVQLARSSEAAGALARMAARFASGDDAIAELVRQLQDITLQHGALDKRLIEAVSAPPDKRNKELELRLRSDLKGLRERAGKLDQQIAEQFPRYAELTRREPLTLEETKTFLGPQEALLTFIRSLEGDQTHVFVVGHEQSVAYTVEVGVEEIEKAVRELRGGLDVEGSLDDLPNFDTSLAFELYEKLLSPSEKYLAGIKHLFIVPDGALQSIPIGILVTKKPDKKIEDFKDYRDVAWLTKKYAITTLPSVASIRALRAFAKRTEASKPFVGVGDPLLEGDPGERRGIEIVPLFHGPTADTDAVRALQRLPETADELRAMASYLGSDEKSIYLRDRATETIVKSLPLQENQVVAFATHGLVSGEIKYLAEPALVLTPPVQGDEHDDGLLTASEIAKLELDAEWVILSACNTASGQKAGAEGLSGLAKAFFYAGARALLVSHWPVETNAATALTTSMFAELKGDPKIGRSEALRRSMLALAANDNHPHYAHPAFWAPFVVVGEGARR